MSFIQDELCGKKYLIIIPFKLFKTPEAKLQTKIHRNKEKQFLEQIVSTLTNFNQ